MNTTTLKRFYSLNQYCQDTFGEKVYRLSLSGGMTCPNRDGSLSFFGCSFCSEGGSGDFAANAKLSIKEQITEAKERICSKTNCRKFIAYFQSFTNTYAPVAYLRQIFTEAINEPDIVALSIGTRCDCLSEDILDLLQELNQIKPVWVELGLQTIHNDTHARLNTHTTVEQYDFAVSALLQRRLSVISHVILGLPQESKEMMLETVKHVAMLYSQHFEENTSVSHCGGSHFGIKLQLLHVLKNTALASTYETAPFDLFTLDEYCDFVIDCIELLPPEMVIHRLTGDGPRNILIAPLWSTDKKRVLNTITKRFHERNTIQGRYYKNKHADF